MSAPTEEKRVLPHHEQRPLCSTRLPYRQGRKLTAVKVYTINTESNHLLIFGVPSLNLRQETKAVLLKFGPLKQFHITEHPGEVFTETYHAHYDKIQSARIAKRMLDTKNFYGGVLHVCYAPELETSDETRCKLLQRKKDVCYRLRNLKTQVEEKVVEKTDDEFIESQSKPSVDSQSQIQPQVYGPIRNEVDLEYTHDALKSKEHNSQNYKSKKLNMGDNNTIYLNKKRKNTRETNLEKKFKAYDFKSSKNIEVIDFTSTERNTLSNINEALNYNKFGNEVIRAVDIKPVNQIKFNRKS